MDMYPQHKGTEPRRDDRNLHGPEGISASLQEGCDFRDERFDKLREEVFAKMRRRQSLPKSGLSL